MKRGVVSLARVQSGVTGGQFHLPWGGGFLVGSAPNRPVSWGTPVALRVGSLKLAQEELVLVPVERPPHPRACLPVPPILFLSFYFLLTLTQRYFSH